MIRTAREEYVQGMPVNISFGTTGIDVPYYPTQATRHIPAEYAPPTAQFVFALIEYPSGSICQWNETVQWSDMEILWASPEFPDRRESVDAEPMETSELREMVEHLIQTAHTNGWEAAPQGRFWCNYRFRKRYDQIDVALKWV